MFLDGIDKPGLVSDNRHNEDNPAAQATFLRHVESLVSSMSEIGNPFMDPSGDLLVLDTRLVADCTIVESVQTIEKIGQQRCDRVYQDRLIARTKQLNDTITKAKLPLFHTRVHKDENQSCPPSLPNHGASRSSTKCDLLVCVSELVPPHGTVMPQEAHVLLT